MRRFQPHAAAGMILFATACGSSASDTSEDAAVAPGGSAGRAGAGGAPSAGRGGSGGSAGSAVSMGVERIGSFDLVLTMVGAGKPTGKMPAPPSVGVGIRVDLSGATALVTPRWGAPRVFQVTEKGASLLLTGDVAIRSGDTTDVWQSFTFDLDATKKLTGQVSSSGQDRKSVV